MPPKWDRREKVGVHPTNWTEELGRQIKDWKQRKHDVVKAPLDKSNGVLTEEYITWYNMFTQRKTSFHLPSQSQSHVQPSSSQLHVQLSIGQSQDNILRHTCIELLQAALNREVLAGESRRYV